MNKKTLEKLAEMKDFQKAYDQQVKEQEVKVLEAMKKAGIGSIKIGIGSFAIVGRKTYQYSSDTQEVETRLKQMQSLEREEGIAKVASESESVRFTSAK